MSFDADIRKFVERTEAKMASVVRDTVVGIGNEAIERSPIGNWDLWSEYWKGKRPESGYTPGTFRDSWCYSIDGMTGGLIIGSIARIDAIHYIYNEADYGMALETGHGDHPKWALTSPNQAYGFADGGAHMVELAIMAAPSIITKAVNKAKAM